MAQKYQVILVNGNLNVEAESLEVDEKGHLNIVQTDKATGVKKVVLQANSRHWVMWMLSDGPPSIVTAPPGSIPVVPPNFGRRN
jgi:hypothetical protein